jgi:arsenic resistance protein ArsH
MSVRMSGDLNNTDAARAQTEIEIDLAYGSRSFAIPASQDDAVLRRSYRPYLLDDTTTASDWIAQLELSTALKMVDTQILNGGQERLRVLILYGSLRQR